MATQKPLADDQALAGADLPPAFDAGYYLSANPDLRISAEAAADHYAATGRAEGRVASPLALRENLIGLIGDGRSVLEIGPFCCPLLRGPNIAYLDVLDAAQLRERASRIGMDPSGCPAHIDYVGGLEQVWRRFDAVISSHAIEHQPDLVHHLQQIERILQPDGLFCLIIPDKRYCFDHYIAESTIADIIEAYREQRQHHGLASVIEHHALTTHNDPRLHWAGDHGPAVRPDRVAQVAKALREHDLNRGTYLDVHAWYFTPDSFRLTIETLAQLGMIGLELAGVYDTAHGRNEFCAVLRLGGEARARASEGRDAGGVVFLQTADAEHYAPMLAITAAGVREYCRRHGFGYESFLGVKRGFHPWQATFNRIPMLEELVARGFTGWAVYLDADAYIQDLDFDLTAYLADKGDRAAIFATSGVTGEHWDVNAGVALINLGHPLGRELVARWSAAFAAHSDETLREAAEWMGGGNDQDLLHDILRQDEAIARAVLVEPMTLLNGPRARFIRQQLRAMGPTLEARMDALAAAVSMVLHEGGNLRAVPLTDADRRWAARFAHPEGLIPALLKASVPEPQPTVAARVAAAWSAVGGSGAGWPRYQQLLAEGLRAGNSERVAAELAGLGRSQAAQGFLGGVRQHERARDRSFARRLASWTHDKLVSLAEAAGVLRLENPENGPWAENALIEPAGLFARLEAVIEADLAPPSGIGGHLGIAVGREIVLHMRMLDAIHAAWRLRQLAETIGLGNGARIAELAGGAGLTAHYALRLGLSRYRLFDAPTMSAIQAYVLAGSGHEVALAGEPDRPAAVLPFSGFAAQAPGSIDILFNADTLPEMERAAAIAHLRDAARVGVRHILSINHEVAGPGQTPLSELLREAGGYRLASRHRHWLRAGYVEELYLRA
nr:methyltransferase domain-containing protein [Sphingomonas sp. Y57]